MLIGNFETKNNIFLAPLAGVSDLAMREICHEFGCGFSYTEMVSAKAMSFNDKKTFALMESGNLATAVQIFGSDCAIMAQAAKKIGASAPVIDINMGCPVAKVVNNGEGSALMKNIALAGEIIGAAVEAASVPVTVKMRLGFKTGDFTAIELAKEAQSRGAAAIAVHGRFRDEFYSGSADWEKIREIKSAVKIPVIGNGDIFTAYDAKRMFDETNVDAVMIGRGALGNPWIFTQINELLETGEIKTNPSTDERLDVAMEHISRIVRQKGEKIGICEARKHAAWYTKGMRGAALVRGELNHASTLDEMRAVLYSLKD